ncbi:hypothetical protein SCP_0600600 [Sparassis crispa]|uniref:Uncharacterized protein n=1 Tax=Sparassis crispa TaxID=139825 RepID=A0A401GPG2_9APHY|nr:hypothetical protein SCP_0600600 [Sparassis crispa]GBE84082.1 hypothetical protein SCP_0600600 [Sparassis crispa]
MAKCAHPDCYCQRYDGIDDADVGPNDPQLCRQCKHIKTAHPDGSEQRSEGPPTIAALLDGLKNRSGVASLPGSRIRTAASSSTAAIQVSVEDAVKETNSGLKRQPIDTMTAGPSKKAKGIKATDTSQGKIIKIGHVILLPDGMDEDGNLNTARGPTHPQIARFVKYGLACSHKDASLEFRTGWNVKRINMWFAQLLPEAFEYMRTKVDKDDVPWVLCERPSANSLAIVDDTPVDGEVLNEYKGGNGRKWTERKLYIASKVEIPHSVYTNNWIAPAVDASDDDASSVGPSESEFLPQNLKGKGKMVPSATETHHNAVIELSDSETLPTVKEILAAAESGNSPPPAMVEELLVNGSDDNASSRANSPAVEGINAPGAPLDVDHSNDADPATAAGVNDGIHEKDWEAVFMARGSEHKNPYLQLSDDLLETKDNPWDID